MARNRKEEVVLTREDVGVRFKEEEEEAEKATQGKAKQRTCVRAARAAPAD